MQLLRRLSAFALVLAFTQIVFGAIVRITGSGMGCGDHWPKCNGVWFPPHDRLDLIIEITHRYIALGLSLVILALVIVALLRRREVGVDGKGGVLRPALVSGVLVVVAALLGAITVKMELNPVVIASHLTIAMSLLATLAVSFAHAGGFWANAEMTGATAKTFRASRVAVGLAIVTLIMGALTANVPNAAAACGGFPWCRTVATGGTPLWIQIIHRVIALMLFGHLWGISAAVAKRKEPRVVVMAARVAFFSAIAQVLIAAAMIEMHFPPALRSLHQAAGTFVWLAVVVLAIVTARAAVGHNSENTMRAAA